MIIPSLHIKQLFKESKNPFLSNVKLLSKGTNIIPNLKANNSFKKWWSLPSCLLEVGVVVIFVNDIKFNNFMQYNSKAR